eukprot:8079798-Pyramimonas_sp.AAC.1
MPLFVTLISNAPATSSKPVLWHPHVRIVGVAAWLRSGGGATRRGPRGISPSFIPPALRYVLTSAYTWVPSPG